MTEGGIILLIDNDTTVLAANRRNLEKRGHTVHAVDTYEEAHRFLRGMEPDIIIMEAMLPGGDGFEFTKEVRGMVETHILFLTNMAGFEDMIKGLKIGGDDYIIKANDKNGMAELMARVDSTMRKRKRSGLYAVDRH